MESYRICRSLDKLHHQFSHKKTPSVRRHWRRYFCGTSSASLSSFVGVVFATTLAAACLSHCALFIFWLSPNAPSTTSAGAFVVHFVRHSPSAWLGFRSAPRSCAHIIIRCSPDASSTTSAGAFVVCFARLSPSAWLISARSSELRSHHLAPLSRST